MLGTCRHFVSGECRGGMGQGWRGDSRRRIMPAVGNGAFGVCKVLHANKTRRYDALNECAASRWHFNLAIGSRSFGI